MCLSVLCSVFVCPSTQLCIIHACMYTCARTNPHMCKKLSWLLLCVQEECTRWLEANRWQTAERSNSANNKKVMEQEMPKLLDTFKQGQVDKVIP